MQEELGGAKMHAEISGTVDFYEKDDPSCLKRLRSLGRAVAGSGRGEAQAKEQEATRRRKSRRRFTI